MFKRVSRVLALESELVRRMSGLNHGLGRRLMSSGVYLPTFESFTEGQSDFGLTGLGRGGQQVQRYAILEFGLI